MTSDFNPLATNMQKYCVMPKEYEAMFKKHTKGRYWTGCNRLGVLNSCGWSARHFSHLEQWPVEHLEASKFRLEPYWGTQAYKDKDDVAHTLAWSSQSPLYKQVGKDVAQCFIWRDRMVDAMGPHVVNEGLVPYEYYHDPYYWRMTSVWRRHCLRRINTWHNYWTAFYMSYMFRRVMPMKPYQVEGPNHKKDAKDETTAPASYLDLMYVVSVAMEFLTAIIVMVDDQIDGAKMRYSYDPRMKNNKALPWAAMHLHAHGNDITTLMCYGIRSVKDAVPTCHPCWRELNEAVFDHLASSNEFFNHQAMVQVLNLLDKAPEKYAYNNDRDFIYQTRAQYYDDLLANYTENSYRRYMTGRGGGHLIATFEVMRYFTCYRDVNVKDGLHLSLAIMGEVMCLTDDLIDTAILVQEKRMDDLSSGEPGNVFLYAAIQDYRTEKNVKVKEKLRKALLDWHGTGSDDDAWQLRYKWESRNIIPRFIAPYAAALRDRYNKALKRAVESSGFPADMHYMGLARALEFDATLTPDRRNVLMVWIRAFLEKPGKESVNQILDYIADDKKRFPQDAFGGI